MGPVVVVTFREAIRNRVLYLLLFFGVVIVLLSRIAGLLTVGDEMKVMQDLGLTVVTLLDVLIAVFVGIELVYKEIDKRTLYLILTKPITRERFLLGKYLGLVLTLLVIHVGMTALLTVYLGLLGRWNPRLLVALYGTLLEVLVVTAVATMFSTWTTPILSGLFTFSVWVIGRASRSLLALADVVRNKSPGLARLIEAVYYCVPNLDRMSLDAYAVHGVALPPGYLLSITVAAGLYAVVMLLLAVLLFQRRDFT